MSKQYFDADGRPTNQFGTPVGPAVPPPPTGAASPVDLSQAPPPVGPGVSAYGVPAPAYQPAYPPVAAPNAARPLRTGMSTGAKIAVALGATGAGLVIVGIMVAIAIPVFLDQRARSEAEHISIALPGAVAGYPRMTGAADAQVQNLVSGLPREAGTAQGAAYGVGRPMVIVIAGRHVMLPRDRTTFLSEVARSESGSGVTQTPVAPGPLGGQMQCGPAADGSRTDCAFTDAGSYGVIDVATTGPSAVSLAQQVRSEIETHR
jgi:hypothetical protein